MAAVWRRTVRSVSPSFLRRVTSTWRSLEPALPWLELGQASEAGICHGHGEVFLMSAGALRLIIAITHAEVMRTIARHLQLSAAPPPLVPVRSSHAPMRGPFSEQPAPLLES
jgi:hypothetical protein